MEVKIEHIVNIIINPRAKIGKNCTIFYGMLIGQQNCRKNNGILKIGDKVKEKYPSPSIEAYKYWRSLAPRYSKSLIYFKKYYYDRKNN